MLAKHATPLKFLILLFVWFGLVYTNPSNLKKCVFLDSTMMSALEKEFRKINFRNLFFALELKVIINDLLNYQLWLNEWEFL